jgi:hypothetical protein
VIVRHDQIKYGPRHTSVGGSIWVVRTESRGLLIGHGFEFAFGAAGKAWRSTMNFSSYQPKGVMGSDFRGHEADPASSCALPWEDCAETGRQTLWTLVGYGRASLLSGVANPQ